MSEELLYEQYQDELNASENEDDFPEFEDWLIEYAGEIKDELRAANKKLAKIQKILDAPVWTPQEENAGITYYGDIRRLADIIAVMKGES